MANVTITQLPSVTSLANTSVLPLVQSNVTSQITASNLRGYVLSGDIPLGAVSANSITVSGTVQAAAFSGNGSQLTGMYGNANVAAYLPTYTGNIRAGNATITGTVTAAAFSGNGSALTGMYGNANVAAYLPTYSGNISAGNVTASGNIQGAWILGNGSQLTGLPEGYGNANVADYLPTYSGNVGAGNVTVVGNVSASYFIGNGSQLTGLPATYSNADVALYLPTYSGDLGDITANSLGAPELTVANNITTSTVTASGNVSASYFLGDGSQLTNLPAGNYSNANVAAYLPTYEGNVGAGNILAAGNVQAAYFLGDGSQLTNLPGGDYSNANVEAYLPTYTGNFTAGNATIGGFVSAAYFLGDGSELTGMYGNTNVANYLPTYGGNIAVGNITPTGTFTIDNQASGNTADINIRSADNILLQGKDMPEGSGAEGGDINIRGGDGAADDGINDSGSGGDIEISGGQGGAANVGGANSGGSVNISAGDAGSGAGNADLGAGGGDVVIRAGDSTGNLTLGGAITLTTGAGGPNAGAGSVEIIVPASGANTGGTWTFDRDGALTATGNITAAGDITATSFIGDGSQLTGMYGNAAVADYLPTYIGNIGAGNINTTGDVTAAFFIGDGSQLTNLPAGDYSNANVANYLPGYTGNIGAGNVITTGLEVQGNAVITGNLRVTGNTTFISSNDLVVGNINIVLANLAEQPSDANGAGIIVGNITGNTYASVLWNSLTNTWTISGNVQSNAATFATVTVSGNTNMSNATVSGNITAARFLGNGSALTGMYGNANVATYLPTYVGNISAGNISVTSNIAAGNAAISGTVTSGNIIPAANGTYSLGNSTRQWRDLWVTSNTIYVGGVPVGISASTLTVNSQPVLANGSNTSITTSGTITASSLVGNITVTGNLTVPGTVNASDFNTTSNVRAGNITANSTVVVGDQATASSTKLRVATATGITYLQVGNGTSGTTGNVVFAPYLSGTQRVAINTASGNITATGNIQGAWILGNIVGNFTNAGNLTAGNLIANTMVQAGSEIYVGNRSNSDAKLRITGPEGGNMYLQVGTGGPSSTGTLVLSPWFSVIPRIIINTERGNITTALGNFSANGLLANISVISGNATATGNVSGGNIITAGQVIATGNIEGGNLTTTGRVDATGNATAGNIATGIMTSNSIATGNISSTGVLTMTRTGLAASGAAQIFLNGATMNRIDFRNVGLGAPAVGTRSAGTKIVLWPDVANTTADYALGIETNTLWTSVPSPSQQFRWYTGNALSMTLNNGNLTTVGNVSGSFILGNGSQLTGITGGPGWSSAGTIQSVGLSATESAPTVSTTSIRNVVLYRQLGPKTWQMQLLYYADSSLGSNSGSGDYLFTLPGGLSFDTTLVTQIPQTSTTGQGFTGYQLYGYAIPGTTFTLSENNNSVYNIGGIIPYSATQYRAFFQKPSVSAQVLSASWGRISDVPVVWSWAFTWQTP